ncbi:helix-turn-helix domain-containing transcriptional regulator [Alcaligenes sp. SDU_A2]|uniref:helix-turn-helix domain-containing transcriptional regulator n=1 Tax=Alcaligenes sp. SDU_A2 TaxID=3136634 RepID=UPI00311FCC68
MDSISLSVWDSTQYLQTEQNMTLYFEACMEDAGDDGAFIAKALGHIARAQGRNQQFEKSV